MADAHKNFAYSTVATAPSPATSGTSLVVAAGDGTKFPTPPFNATVWPANTQPLTTNAEIVRVTAISTDTFTITRAQESSTAMSVATGYQIAATITVKTLTDVETDVATKAANGANSDITSLSGLTTALSVAQGGTGLKTLTSGNFLTASGTTTVATSKVAPAGAVVGTSDTQTLTNKTLTTPKIDAVIDSSGLNLLTYTGVASAVNYLDLKNNGATFSPALTAVGTDTDISVNIVPKGAGRIRANGVIVPTTTSSDTLTNKTLTGGLVTADPSAALGIASKQYVDALGSTSLVRNETPGGLINGSNTAYTTASTFATGSLKIYLNGQRLAPGSGIDYVEGTQAFTMQYAPATGDVLLVDYETTNTAFIQGSNSIIVQETPTGTVNGTTTLFTVLQGKYVANTLEVFINGLQQTKTTDYTETSPGSGTFTFTTAPVTGDVVKVSYQFSTGASGNADTVDGIHASSTPTASTLVPLDSNARFDQATLPLGAVVQVVTTNYSSAATGTTQIPLDGTIPQSTEGDQYMSQTITPKSSTNLLVIEAYAMLSNSGAANSMAMALFQDSGASAIAVSSNNLQGGTAGVPIPLKFSMTAGTTSATTFKIRAGYSTTGTTSFNATSGVANTYGTVPKSYIQITEYKA